MSKIRIAIVGYGNLGRGVESAIAQNADMELVAMFTRRDPSTVKLQKSPAPVCAYDDLPQWQGKIDVMILCGGSATDLVEQSPYVAQWFNIIDSYDNHSQIPEYFAKIDEVAQKNATVALISVGWDPGLLSVQRMYNTCILPQGQTYTFWGKGVSQGHSDAVRRVQSVLDARQYTIPIDSALEQVRQGENPQLSPGQRHRRECFVVAEAGADLEKISQEIKSMPGYFVEYETTVHFISAQELAEEHGDLPHGGRVIHSALTGFDLEHKQRVEFAIALDSNPEFTASVIVAHARAVQRLSAQGQKGAFTIFDIAPGLLSPESPEDLRR